jgi:phenylalanyl-tRNA synthetase alpha chain
MSAQGPNLAELEAQARDEVAAANSAPALAEVRAAYLGRKGSVAGVLRTIGSLEAEERGRVGKEANEVKARIEALVAERKQALAQRDQSESLSQHQLDVSLPGAGRPLGHVHPLTRVLRDLEDFFWSRGYSIEEGPEVETEYNNFDALNMPDDHPAREMQDTFWVQDGHVLRTHTSPVQIRAMSEREPPFYIVAPGRVYRHDLSPRHSPMFAQVEGFAVDESLNFGDLKGLLFDFASHMMGDDMELRFRSSYFPFTEPSAEIDFRCLLCCGDGCATCSQTGWIEWGGCGMIHPEVLRNCKIDPDRWQGFAFGMGLERVAMLRHGVSHIRLLYEGDVRVLEQF